MDKQRAIDCIYDLINSGILHEEIEDELLEIAETIVAGRPFTGYAQIDDVYLDVYDYVSKVRFGDV